MNTLQPLTYESLRLFIMKWWESDTIDDFCTATGYDRRTASNTAAGLRRLGVKLKCMPREARSKRPILSHQQIWNLVDLGNEMYDKVVNGIEEAVNKQ